jgi:hypothetical protein
MLPRRVTARVVSPTGTLESVDSAEPCCALRSTHSRAGSPPALTAPNERFRDRLWLQLFPNPVSQTA